MFNIPFRLNRGSLFLKLIALCLFLLSQNLFAQAPPGFGGAPGAAQGLPKVRVVKAATTQAYTEVLYGGRIEPLDRFDIRAPIAGVIEKITVREGERVKPGDALFIMRREASGRVFQAVEVPASQNGRISIIHLRTGDTVSEGGRVLTLVDDSSLKITLLVSDRDVQEIKQGDLCDLYDGAAPLGLSARINRIALEPDYTSGLFEVHLRLPVSPEMRIGRFLRVKLKKNLFEGIVVDTSNLSRRYGKVYLQVLTDNGTIELREITTGRSYGQRTAVLSGIRPGEQYVIWSDRRLSEGDSVEVIE